jgi:hypothetical protein
MTAFLISIGIVSHLFFILLLWISYKYNGLSTAGGIVFLLSFFGIVYFSVMGG